MSSALKPALPSASGQTSPGNATSAAGKAVMSPGAQAMTQHSTSAASYPSGPLAHVPQNLTGLAHVHGNIGMSATNSTNMAANISVNAVPNMSLMGSHSAVNQGTPAGPTKAAGGGSGTGTGAAIPASSVPTSSAAGTTAATVVPLGRPTAHPYLSSVTAMPASASATHPARDEEGTTLPASQNSAQLMAVHKAQQNQQPQQHHHPQQSQQSPQQQQQSQPQQQPHHNDQQSQNITDRFKQNQQQQQQQTPQQQQQAAQSNGTMSGPADATCNKTTVPTPPATADGKTESSPQTAVPPVQNHVPTPSSTVTHEQNNTKQPVDATTPTSTAVPPPPPLPTPTSASSEPKPTPAAVITPSAAEPAAEPSSQNVATTPTKTAVVPKETPKTPSTLKLATTPRTTNRKRETKMTKTSESPKGNATSSVKTTDGRSPGAQNNKPPDRTPKNARTVSDEDRKSKRTRTRTQPYQSPLPELALISKLSSAGSSSPSKAHDEKLIVFYKNEFLAVRNAEGGFYVCQAVQNVYKSSPRIRIRWLSQDKQDKIYIPDFYDFTDFDCILTNLNMERVEKGKYNLPKDELERTENILKRALAVESGGSAPSLTEEHPDGLDLSLFRDESQLKKKRKSAKRKSTEPLSASSGDLNNSRTRKTPDKMKVRKVSKSPATKSTIKRNNQQAQSDRRTTVNATSAGGNNEKKDGAGRTSRRSDSGRAERAKRRNESTGSTASKTSPVVDPKKARVLAKVALKTAIPAAAIVAVAQNKKKVGRTAPSTKAPTGNASSVKVGTKTLTRSSQAPASSTAAAATIVTTAASSAPSTRRGKKTKK